jgi:methionine synthase II (cobalamin-independent)
MVGVIDVGDEAVETPEIVASRIRAALCHVPAERLLPSTDCGLVPRSRASAVGKMRALAAGAEAGPPGARKSHLKGEFSSCSSGPFRMFGWR